MIFRCLIVLALIPSLSVAAEATVVKNVVVYHERGRYGGWPANHGIWWWGNEILVGFSAAYFKRQSPDHHQYDRAKPENLVLRAASMEVRPGQSKHRNLCFRRNKAALPSRNWEVPWISTIRISR
jgi:hypothetical protein